MDKKESDIIAFAICGMLLGALYMLIYFTGFGTIFGVDIVIMSQQYYILVVAGILGSLLLFLLLYIDLTKVEDKDE